MSDGENAATAIPDQTLVLLGRFRLTLAGRPEAFSSTLSRLVALLGLHDGLERGRVVDLLWPDVAPQRAHANLRSTLWRVQRTAPGLVVASGELLELPDDVVVDARSVEEWATGVIRGENRPGLALPPSAGGPLLPGWDQEWLVEHRERLHLVQMQAFELQAEHLLRAGREAEALWFAFRALQMDALRESAAELTIRIHLAQGNLADAIRVFERFRRSLRRELGVEPSPALSAALTRPRLRGER